MKKRPLKGADKKVFAIHFIADATLAELNTEAKKHFPSIPLEQLQIIAKPGLTYSLSPMPDHKP